MSHFGESDHNNKNGIPAISRSRQTKHKIHANIFPWLIRNCKRHIQSMRLSFRLSFATCRASVGEAVDVTKHLRPKVVLGERSKGLLASKMSYQSSSMRFLQKQQTKRRLGDAKFVSSHKITIFDVITIPRCMHQTLGIRNSKSRIMRIQVFYVLKANVMRSILRSSPSTYLGSSRAKRTHDTSTSQSSQERGDFLPQ